MRKLSSMLATVLAAGSLLAACTEAPGERAAEAGTGKPPVENGTVPKQTQPVDQKTPEGQTNPDAKPEANPEQPKSDTGGGSTERPVGEEATKTPGTDPSVATGGGQSGTAGTAGGSGEKATTNEPRKPAPTVTAQTYDPSTAAKPTAADLKAVSWYYMKKKKGEVPNFPAETKQFKPEQKAVWVGTGKKVYMTIDVGGELLDYETLLKAFRDNNVKATFFVTGYNLRNNPDYIRLLLEEGHSIGNHTITHKDFTTLTDEQVHKEIKDYEELYRKVTGEEPTPYFRFPYGKYSGHLLTQLSRLGYTSYFWSTAMKDWEPRKNGADDAYNDVIGNLHDGNIILMHQASKENIEAMDRILKQIKEEGYTFGTLDELLE